jgi:hypothetical protein
MVTLQQLALRFISLCLIQNIITHDSAVSMIELDILPVCEVNGHIQLVPKCGPLQIANSQFYQPTDKPLIAKQSHSISMKAQGERRHSSYSFTTSVLDGGDGQRYAPAALYPRGKDP